MAETPSGGRQGRPPKPVVPPRVLTYTDEPDDALLSSSWKQRPPYGPIVAVVVVVAVIIGVVLSRGPGPEAGADRTLTPQRMVPAGAPTPEAGQPGREGSPGEVEASAATAVELAFRATDASGTMLPDTLLLFAVESGTGTLAADTARTDSLGIARALVMLSPRPEITVVAARVVGAELPPVRVTVTSRAGPPQRLARVGGNGQRAEAGGLLTDSLMVLVTDAAQNPVPGVEVRFQPDQDAGLVAPSRILTDSLGRAFTRWRLGQRSGAQRLTAAVPGTQIPSLRFTATAVGGTSAQPVSAPPDADSTAEVPEPTGPDSARTEAPEPEPAPVVVIRRTFSVGGSFVCGLAGGRVACRGANDRGQLSSGGPGGFEGLTTGVSHACALDVSGTAWCWGANDSGQLGDGSRSDRSVPTRVSSELAFSTLAAGAGHTCGLDSGGRAACWGGNLSGQLGNGTRNDRSTPAPVPGNRSFQSLVAGWEHTCGLGAGGALACWGANGQGQLGDGSRLDRLVPTTITGSFRSVVAGSRHTCGISGERVLCWGDNSFGQLGDGSTQGRERPTPVAGLPAPPTRLVAGAVHTCALLRDGTVSCWGQNLHGQLGDGTNVNRTAPSPVAGGLTFNSLFAGGALTCGFSTEGGQYCWGLNQSGQLGDGTRDNRTSPARVGR